MCQVKSLVFRDGYPVRITYYKPNSKTFTLTSFNKENLMQGSDVKDKNGTFTFEKDIILIGKRQRICETLDFVNSLKDSVEGFTIIGNTFLGE